MTDPDFTEAMARRQAVSTPRPARSPVLPLSGVWRTRVREWRQGKPQHRRVIVPPDLPAREQAADEARGVRQTAAIHERVTRAQMDTNVGAWLLRKGLT